MKPEEAIEIIEKQIVTCEAMIEFNENFDPEEDNTKLSKEKEALLMAVQSIRKVQQYQEIGTVEECRKAVEKQKVKYIKIESYCPAYCPTCRFELSESLGDGYYEYFENLSRCPKCGQKICWDEDLEEMEDESSAI